MTENTPCSSEQHSDLTDCIRLVAAAVWDAAWREARDDQEPDALALVQVEHLVDHGDFLEDALRQHNWRNVSAVLAAFRDAGLAGTPNVTAFYKHVDRIPIPKAKTPLPPLPEWCGECDGPEPGRRMVDVPVPEGKPALAKWCPRCEPRSLEYQAAHAATEG